MSFQPTLVGDPYFFLVLFHVTIRYFRHHQAAVKALAWCPWQPNVLASGGGTADRCIRLWNGSHGTLLNTIDTKSQVCSLLWASQYKELVSAHGCKLYWICSNTNVYTYYI